MAEQPVEPAGVHTTEPLHMAAAAVHSRPGVPAAAPIPGDQVRWEPGVPRHVAVVLSDMPGVVEAVTMEAQEAPVR